MVMNRRQLLMGGLAALTATSLGCSTPGRRRQRGRHVVVTLSDVRMEDCQSLHKYCKASSQLADVAIHWIRHHLDTVKLVVHLSYNEPHPGAWRDSFPIMLPIWYGDGRAACYASEPKLDCDFKTNPSLSASYFCLGGLYGFPTIKFNEGEHIIRSYNTVAVDGESTMCYWEWNQQHHNLFVISANGSDLSTV